MNKNRKLTRFSIDLILAFSDKLRSEKDHWKHTGEKDIQDVAGGYITSIMLNGIYNILINEGYPKIYLDKFFFNDDYPNTYKEWTKEACKFYLRGDPDYNKYIEGKKAEDFFYKTIRGIKLRKEIDKLSGE